MHLGLKPYPATSIGGELPMSVISELGATISGASYVRPVVSHPAPLFPEVPLSGILVSSSNHSLTSQGLRCAAVLPRWVMLQRSSLCGNPVGILFSNEILGLSQISSCVLQGMGDAIHSQCMADPVGGLSVKGVCISCRLRVGKSFFLGSASFKYKAFHLVQDHDLGHLLDCFQPTSPRLS